MCNGDLMNETFVDNFDASCAQIDVAISLGQVDWECDSLEMETARFYCCEDYVVQECNLIFLVTKQK